MSGADDKKLIQSSASDRASGLLSSERSGRPPQSILEIGPQSLLALKVELENAEAAFSGARYDEARAIAERVQATAERFLTGAPQDPGGSERIDPGLLQAGALSLVARIHERQGRHELARETAARAVEIFKLSAQSIGLSARDYYSLGSVLLTVGCEEEAIEALEQARKCGPYSAELYALLANTLNNRKMYERAEQVLNDGLRIAPGDNTLQRAMGEVFEASGRLDKAAEVYLEAGTALVQANRLEESFDLLEHARRLRPENPKILATIGEVLRLKTMYAESLGVIEQALSLEPDNAQALATKGAALRGLERNVEALEALNRALALQSEWPFALSVKADTLNGLGRNDEALAAIDQALALAPGEPWALGTKGQILCALGRYKEAIETLQSAINTAPTLTWMRLILADSLRGEGRNQEALATLDSVLAATPNDPWALGRKGSILSALARNEEAVATLRRAVAEAPQVPGLLGELAASLRASGQYDEALAAIGRVLDSDPDNAWGLREKGANLTALGRYDQAIEVLQRALQLDSKSAFAFSVLGSALAATRRYQEALSAFNQALEFQPDSATLVKKGDVLRSMGRYEEACVVLRRAVELDPQSSAFAELGDSLRLAGRNEEALAALDKALALDPNNAWLLGTKGQVLRTLGQLDKAIEVLGRAIKIGPEMKWLHGELGEALRLAAKFPEALASFDRADADDGLALASKGATLWALERDEEALTILDQALGLHEVDRQWTLGMKGTVLNDVAEYEAALAALDEALGLSGGADWIWAQKGWALYCLGPSRAEDSLAAHEAGLRLAGESAIWLQKGVGDALHLLGKEEDAGKQYRALLEVCHKSRAPEVADAMYLSGWCQYRLGEFDQAVSTLIDVVSHQPDRLSYRFDLALSMMCSGRHELAEKEYRTGVQLVSAKNPLRRRSLLRVAIDDLADASRTHPELVSAPQMQRFITILTEVYKPVMDLHPRKLQYKAVTAEPIGQTP